MPFVLVAILLTSFVGAYAHSSMVTVTVQVSYPSGSPTTNPKIYYSTNGTYRIATLTTSGAQVQVDLNTTLYPDVVVNPTSNQTWCAVPICNGLGGYWPLDEGTGTNAYDLSGNNRTGTLVNSPMWNDTSCRFGDCLSFSGSNYISTTATPTNSGSFSLWVRPAAFTAFATPISAKTASNGYVLIENGVAPAYRWCGVLNPTGSNESDACDAELVPGTNTWYFLTLTWSGETMAFYVDGVSQGTAIYSGALSSALLATDIGIGASASGGNLYAGIIDDVRFYNHALTACEISELYSMNVPRVESQARVAAQSIRYSYYGERLQAINSGIVFPSFGQILTANLSGVYWIDSSSRVLIVNANPPITGTMTPPVPISYERNGSDVNLQATPIAGYRFENWTCSGEGCYSGMDNPITVVVNHDIVETANFVAIARDSPGNASQIVGIVADVALVSLGAFLAVRRFRGFHRETKVRLLRQVES